MPSGAKKRKAARKKKEKETNNTNNPQGNDDLKSQDEKGSDGGEGNSPAYREHDDHHHPFNDANEEAEERDPLAAQPHVSDVKSVEEVPSDVKIDQVLGGKEDSVGLVEGGLKPEESSESENVSLEHIETAKESFHENANIGNTSNRESRTEKNSKDENCDLFEETIACHELVKSIDSSPPKTTSVGENVPVDETINLVADSCVSSVKAVASVSKVEKSDTGSVLLGKSVVHPVEVTNLTMKINKDNVYPLANENVAKSIMEEPKPKESDSKVLDSLSASSFTKFTNGAEHVKDSETAECSEHQPEPRVVVSAPNVVQKTSLLSCCGLFEVLSSSNR